MKCLRLSQAVTFYVSRITPIPMDLTTTYLGLKLRTPLVPSASPLSEEIDSIKRMEDAGASAVVL